MTDHVESFEGLRQAQAYVGRQVDVPLAPYRERLGDGMEFSAGALELPGGRFSNVYDISFPSGTAKPAIHIPGRLASVYDFACQHPAAKAVASGGFFFLADNYSAMPPAMALNLAIADGRPLSLPVSDREAVVCEYGRLSAEHVAALGVLSLDGADLTWSGSLTAHQTDFKLYSNGNASIQHVPSHITGVMRRLDDNSRFTPPLSGGEAVDLGFTHVGGSSFRRQAAAERGGLDIFGYDLVLRGHPRYAASRMLQVRTIGNLLLHPGLQGALSAGPMVHEADFAAHPVNADLSLGDKPPFAPVAKARPAVFGDGAGRTHLRLYDGRPESEVFNGVTPQEAAGHIASGHTVEWGCFLDSGQTAKLCVRGGAGPLPVRGGGSNGNGAGYDGDEVRSFGNNHYLQWPRTVGERYIWVPRFGRPMASFITVQ